MEVAASLQHAAERRLAAAQDGIASDLRVALEEARSRIVAERARTRAPSASRSSRPAPTRAMPAARGP